jgi:urease accessory protein
MRMFTERIAPSDAVDGVVQLPFERRQRSRLRVSIATGPLAGATVGLDLPRGLVLRGGDHVRSADGRVLRIEAAPERLCHVVAGSRRALARIAYHLGNRHVPVELGDGWLRLEADPVLERMIEGLGATIAAVEAPFEPEAGAYGHAGHDHDHDHDHGHGHGHGHGHDHEKVLDHDNDHGLGNARDHRLDHARATDRRHAPRIHDLLENRGSRE